MRSGSTTWETLGELTDDRPGVRVPLPDGCACVGIANTERDHFTCEHGRRWQLSIGEARPRVIVREVTGEVTS